ncbi:spore germination protein [Neobacillus cucumis]|uniref:spore germination protein n=1 Tax=Neobacillus cucumis TaxID=1740721 RepID=UPI0011581663|nr:spore germination protein [Neobacillus cucumis]
MKFIHITNFSVDSLSNNANINIGPTLQNSHTANSIIVGSNINIGDHGKILSKIINKGTNITPSKDSGD